MHISWRLPVFSHSRVLFNFFISRDLTNPFVFPNIFQPQDESTANYPALEGNQDAGVLILKFKKAIFMRKYSWLILGTIIFFCAFLIQPETAWSASSKSSTHKTLVKKQSAKKTAAKKTTAKKTASAKAKKAEVAKADSDRDVWLKRAQNSEALTGKASWYGKDFHNKATASGLAYDMHTFTAAHRTLPIGTIVKVTDQNNGKSVMVCVTDRGPFIKGRIIDVSYAAARELGLDKRGVGKVALEVVSDEHGAPLKKDQAYYISYSSGGGANKVGPFHAFADAAAMHEALNQAHPEAKVILDKNPKQ